MGLDNGSALMGEVIETSTGKSNVFFFLAKTVLTQPHISVFTEKIIILGGLNPSN